MKSRGLARCAIGAAVALSCAPFVSGAEKVKYEYDALGRLTRTETLAGSTAGAVTTYTFDAAGNRTEVKVAGAPEVVNPSFETPNVTTASNGFQYRPTSPNGMTFAGGAGIAANGSAWTFATAPEGNQVGFVQGGSNATGTITQQVSGLKAGSTYEVRFLASSRPGYAATSITVSVDNTPKGTFGMGFTFAAYRSSTFIAQGPTATLAFTTALMTADSASGIDMVTVVQR